ncbi:hypothetical protein [Gilvimarinus chinensis]|uniref:hypothetical protein n=1 Tax=Gilvimarinus chinensis TaxID=396005 RepID=UPI00036047CF|nr:hypothetical protein [Gilvimarinus chinensis]
MKVRYWLFVLSVLVASGCARQVMVPTGAHCPELYSATAFLTLRQHDSPVRLLLRAERTDEGFTFVALDTLGAPLFVARTAGGEAQEWQIEVNKLYRGPAASELIEAYSWWQRRAALTAACAMAAGFQLTENSERAVLFRGKKPWWQWQKSEPMQYQYGGISVTINETQTAHPQDEAAP